MWTQIKTAIGSLMQRIGSFVGSKAVVVTSYLPMIAAVVFGGGLALMPSLFDMVSWAYIVTIPLGVAGGFAAYMAVYMAMED